MACAAATTADDEDDDGPGSEKLADPEEDLALM